MDQISIKRGLEALADLVQTQGGPPGKPELAGLASTEREVDELIEAIVAHLDKARKMGESQAHGFSEVTLTEEDFQKGIMTALEGERHDTDEGDARDGADGMTEVGREVAPLWERLKVGVVRVHHASRLFRRAW